MSATGRDMLLEESLRRLRLPAMLQGWRECLRQAQDNSDGYEEFLLALVTRELEQRQDNQLRRRLKEAHFPLIKTLEKTDLNRWTRLVAAREERQLKRYLARLARYPLLAIDEVGYIPFTTEGAQLLFQVFSDRYEQGSLLVTSNLPFAQWTSVLGDPTLTAALLGP